jgi:hypothetical protein
MQTLNNNISFFSYEPTGCTVATVETQQCEYAGMRVSVCISIPTNYIAATKNTRTWDEPIPHVTLLFPPYIPLFSLNIQDSPFVRILLLTKI